MSRYMALRSLRDTDFNIMSPKSSQIVFAVTCHVDKHFLHPKYSVVVSCWNGHSVRYRTGMRWSWQGPNAAQIELKGAVGDGSLYTKGI